MIKRGIYKVLKNKAETGYHNKSRGSERMVDRCKKCKMHHNAGHSKGDPLAKAYNDWCCRGGKTVKKALGECMLKKWKEEI